MFELLDQYQVKELHIRDDADSGLKAFIAIQIQHTLSNILNQFKKENRTTSDIADKNAREKLHLDNLDFDSFSENYTGSDSINVA